MRLILFAFLGWTILSACKKVENLKPAHSNPEEFRFTSSRLNNKFSETPSQLIYEIKYTTLVEGKEIEASGLILIPKGGLKYPVVSYQHGTIMSDEETPSKSIVEDNPYKNFTNKGYITIVADYVGYNSNETAPPYFIKKLYATSVIDMLKAANQLLKKQNIPFSNDLYLVGYSEGGYATLDVQKYWEENEDSVNNILDFRLKGSVAVSGVYNLEELASKIYYAATNGSLELRGMALSFIGYMFNSYEHHIIKKGAEYYYNVPFNQILSNPAVNIYNGKLSQPEISNLWKNVIEKDLNESVFSPMIRESNVPELMNAFKENSLHNWTPKTKLLLISSYSDELVPFSMIQDTYNEMKRNGGNVELLPVSDGSGHIAMAEKSFGLAVDYLIKLRSSKSEL